MGDDGPRGIVVILDKSNIGRKGTGRRRGAATGAVIIATAVKSASAAATDSHDATAPESVVSVGWDTQ